MKEFEIQKAIIDNLFAYYRVIGNTQQVSYGKNIYYEWISTNIDNWPRIVFNLSNTHNFKEVMGSLKNEIINDKIPPFFIIDDAQNKNIDHNYIDNLGFKPVMQWKGMYFDSNTIFDSEKIESFRIKKATQDYEIEDFVSILNATLLKSNTSSFDLFKEINKKEGISMFNGYFDKIITSSSISYISNKIGGLYMIATLENYRGRGFGTSITQKAMREIVQKEINNIILHATKLGEKIYSKLGFKTYCNLYIYWLLGKK